MMRPRFCIDLLKDRIARYKYNRESKLSGQGSAILMFHHVAQTCPEGVDESCYSSINEFKWLIDNISRTKTFVSLDEICSELDAGVVPKDKMVITFDDVPEDVYLNALPFLREHSIPYTLYVSVNFIDEEDMLSSEQIIELSKDPLCTIGSHTVTHCMLKKSKEVLTELSASKAALEELTGKEILHFAYPYGTPFAISKKVMRQTETSGLYRSAVCTIPGFINKYSLSHRFSLPRIHSKLFTKNYLVKVS